jgi:signal transduction histidine kinase
VSGRVSDGGAAGSRWLPSRLDAIVGLILAIGLQLEVQLSGALHGPRLANAAGALLVAGPMAWRSRAPLAALGVFSVGAIVQTAWLTSVPDSVVAVVCLLLLSYSIGSHEPLRPAIAGLLYLFAAIIAVTGLVGFDKPDNDWVFPCVFFGLAPWVTGRIARNRRLLSAELAAKSAQLERDREERARRAVDEERTRIARELHDLVAHSVSTMVVQAGAGRRLVDTDPERARGTAFMIETSGREALTELRRLLGVLRRGDEELALAPQPSLARIDRLIARARDAGLTVDLRIEGDPAPLSKVVDLAAYRVVQEALTNTIQHAGAATATVLVRYRDEEVQVEVADTGAGPHPGDGDGRDGHGLVGMRERVALVGGELEVGRRRGGGFAVRARLPLEAVAV